VGGYVSRSAEPPHCPALPPGSSPLDDLCSTDFAALVDRAGGPSQFSILLGGEASGDSLVQGFRKDPVGGMIYAPIVVIGHTGDPRAWGCVGDARAGCVNRLVVDDVYWLDGLTVPPTFLRPLHFRLAPGAALAALQSQTQLTYVNVVPVTRQSVRDDVDPRLIHLMHTPAWIGYAMAGGPDANGTEALFQVVLNDRTGLTGAHMPVGQPANYQPAALFVNLTVTGNATSAWHLLSGRRAIATGTGGAFNPAAIVDPGTYTLLLAAVFHEHNVPHALRTTCRKPLTLGPASQTEVDATLKPKGICEVSTKAP